MTIPTVAEMQHEIETAMTTELANNGFEPSTLNMLQALQGLEEAWKEDGDDNPVKSLYQLALTFLIMRYHRIAIMEAINTNR